MWPSARSLGRRLRELRQASNKTQREVAKALGVSRSTVAQIELGNRNLRAEEVDRLATLYGCSIATILSAERARGESEPDIADDLARTTPQIAERAESYEQVRHALAAARTLTELEAALGLDVLCSGPLPYGYSKPRTAWEAVQQGYSAAEEERRRLNLGEAPVRDMDELLLACRVRVAPAELPAGINCLYLRSADTGHVIVANRCLPVESRRFCYAHGYAHALFDAERQCVLCRESDQESLVELRASAFAGRFLVPERAVRQYLQSLGKEGVGRVGGSTQRMFTGQQANTSGKEEAVRVKGPGKRRAAPIGLLDLVQLARYFGVRRSLVAHCLRNYRLLSDAELEAFERLEAEGKAALAESALANPEPPTAISSNALNARITTLAVEALKRQAIDSEKFNSVLAIAGCSDQQRQALLQLASP